MHEVKLAATLQCQSVKSCLVWSLLLPKWVVAHVALARQVVRVGVVSSVHRPRFAKARTNCRSKFLLSPGQALFFLECVPLHSIRSTWDGPGSNKDGNGEPGCEGVLYVQVVLWSGNEELKVKSWMGCGSLFAVVGAELAGGLAGWRAGRLAGWLLITR